MVDDRWGMAEINLLKGQWRSWVLPRPTLDPAACAEWAALWPLSQLLRPRGVTLLPAAAVARGGWAALVLCPFGLGPELAALVRAGYKVIGQRWTALREEDGRVALLHLPGHVERCGGVGPSPRIDLGGQYPGSAQRYAFCDAVLVAEPGRRPRPAVRVVGPDDDAALLRSAWPIPDLHPQRRPSPLPAKLAQGCRVAQVQLSRNPADLLPLLHALRDSRPGAALAA